MTPSKERVPSCGTKVGLLYGSKAQSPESVLAGGARDGNGRNASSISDSCISRSEIR